MPRLRRCGLLAALILLAAAPASAHPISVVVESAFVERDRVTIEVEAFAEDLVFYHGLKADDRNEVSGETLRSVVAAHGELLLERLPVFDAAGRRVAGRVAAVTADEFDEAIPIGRLMEYTLTYRLELPLAEPPAFLSFSQRLVDSTAGFPALVDFSVRQAGREGEAAEATLKPGHVRTVAFSWDGVRDAAADREAWLRVRRDDALAATALNTVRSFLYVTRREVRHELLMPVPLLESYLTVDRGDPDFLTPAEQMAAAPAVADYFRGRNPLSIDGEPRTPTDVRVEFFNLTDRDLAASTGRRTVSAVGGRVGVILSYPTERPARELTLVWNAFNRQAWRVDAFCFAGGEVTRPEFSMAKRKDTFTWTRPEPPAPVEAQVAAAPSPPRLALPWLVPVAAAAGGVASVVAWRRGRRVVVPVVTAGLVLAAWRFGPQATVPHPFPSARVVTDGEADAIVARLHSNLYLALAAATDEEAVAALSAAADGELLRTLYLQYVRNVRDADEEAGTLPEIDAVRLLAGGPADAATADGFDYAARWEVDSRVEHWGHVHTRRHRYDAVLRVEPRAGRWSLTAMDLRDARLVADSAAGGSI